MDYPHPQKDRPVTRHLALLAALCILSSSVRADATGFLMEIGGTPWPAREAVAMRVGSRIWVMVTSQPIDWIDFAADGKLDAKDFTRHRASSASTIELIFDKNGNFLSGQGYALEDRNPADGWKLRAADPKRIAGTFDYFQTNTTFDVPIRDTALEPSDQPLTATSAPVKALVALFDAISRGDVEAVLAASATPEEVKAADAGVRAEYREAIRPTPRTVQRIDFKQGRVAGNAARIDYTAVRKIPDAKVHQAHLLRIDGRWIVTNAQAD